MTHRLFESDSKNFNIKEIEKRINQLELQSDNDMMGEDIDPD